MKKKYIVVGFLLISTLSINLQAQTDSDAEMLAYYSSLKRQQVQPSGQLKAQPGTYQFFIIGEDSTQLLRTDFEEKIETYRDENTVVHLKVSSSTTIRILPCSEITSTRFNPINKKVIFQTDTKDPYAKR